MDRKTRHKVRRVSTRKRHTRKRRHLSALDMETLNAISHHNFTYYDGKIPPIKNGRLQCTTTHGVVLQDGFRYRYKCERHDETTLRIDGGTTAPCFILMIHPDHKTGHLQDIARRDDCSLDQSLPRGETVTTPLSGGLEPGATMKAAGKAAFQVAREYGIRQIQLTDNSSKLLPSGKKFRLSLMKFLTTGQTWYESFLPVHPLPEKVAKVEQWRNAVRTNKWSDVYTCLRTANPDIVIPVDISDIDVTLPGSAMLVYHRISLLQNNNLQQLANPCGEPQGSKEARTDFFADVDDDDLMKCNDIGALYGMTWIADV